MTWERARSEEQIEYRVNEILEATAKLYKEHRFEEITFVMIAKEAGFTRSNLYRYFKTKEDIFLKLLENDIVAWGKDIAAIFTTEVEALPDFAKEWVTLMLKHERMLEIYTILYTLLEKNATLEALVDFKRMITNEIGAGMMVLSKILPFQASEQARVFLHASMSLATGIYPLMHLTPKQQEAVEIVGIEMSQDFARATLEKSTLALLKGMLN